MVTMARYRIVHVLWSPQTGPICGYDNPSLAYIHARTMLGVEVSTVEIRATLPEIARQDIEIEYEGDEVTPVEIEDIDDAEKPSKK